MALGAFLEGLSFWPSPTADQNLARDAGRLLQGKEPTHSTGLDEQFRGWGGPILPWKRRAEQAEVAIAHVLALAEKLTTEHDPDDQSFTSGRNQVGTELLVLLSPSTEGKD